MATYTYPTAEALSEIEQELLPRLEADRPIFGIMPVRNKDAHNISWEIQDNFLGLQQIRGLNGQPARVKRVGAKKYEMEPGVYGEFEVIDEVELTTRRQLGTFDAHVNIDDLVRDAQEQLLQRRLDRIEQIGWDLLATGTFSVAAPNGAVLHTDTFSLQTASAAVVWSTAATATPLVDFRAVRLLQRGKGVSFGRDASAWMNQAVFDEMIANTNSSDLFGRRTAGLATIGSQKDINTVLLEENLPQININDDGYFNDSGTFTQFVPADKVVIVGKRRGATPIAEYFMTRNVNNPNMAPGAYTRVVQDPNLVPASVEVHDGHNGGPVINYPSNIVILSV